MLLELAVGDAYGAGFEYNKTPGIQNQNTLKKYIKHAGHKDLKPGMYTDDTQMSIAIAEVIVSGKPWIPEVLAKSFVDCFKRDIRAGYAHGFYQLLTEVKDGQELLAKCRGDSDKSGAAMRAPPIGIFSSIDEVIEKATIQARITHNTPDGINAAAASALTTHYFIYDKGSKNDLAAFIEKYVPGKWSTPWTGEVGSKGWQSVRAAITAVMKNHTLSRLLKECIAFEGDVDTVAAIAMAAASCSKEYEKDIPERLYTGLENGKYGLDFLKELDARLMNLKKK